MEKFPGNWCKQGEYNTRLDGDLVPDVQLKCYAGRSHESYGRCVCVPDDDTSTSNGHEWICSGESEIGTTGMGAIMSAYMVARPKGTCT